MIDCPWTPRGLWLASRRFFARAARSSALSRGSVAEGIQEGGGGGEEEAAGCGAAEVEEAVVIAGRAADEHVFEHLLGGARGAAVAEGGGAKFALAGFAEGHVVSQDFQLFAVFVDGGEGAVCVGRFDSVAELD